jgi:hypothetical protein
MTRAVAPVRLALAIALCAAAGCVEKTKPLSKAEQEQQKDVVSRTRPTPSHALAFEFEGKVRLIGYDLDPPSIREGEPFRLTWHWEVLAPLGDGWKVFTHLADAAKKSRINLDATRILRRVYPEHTWQRGDFVKDVQEVTLPSDWNSPAAIFYLGFYRDEKRLRITKGPNDGDDRAEVLRVTVAPETAREPTLPRLIPHFADGPIQIDGKLDEAAWASTQPSGSFVNTLTGGSGAFAASCKVLYDAKQLYVAFEVRDEDLRSPHTQADDHLWEKDAVEIMIDPDGDARNYFEIQVSPRGTVFDTRYDAPRKPLPFGDVAWSSRAFAKVALDGTLDDDEDDRGYTAEIALPWSAFVSGETSIPPPAAGDIWRMNFYVMDAADSGQRAVCWSPPLIGDFHVPKRFGRVAFTRAASATSGAPAVPVTAPATMPTRTAPGAQPPSSPSTPRR